MLKYGIKTCPFDIYSSILVRVHIITPNNLSHTYVRTYIHTFMCCYQTVKSQNRDINSTTDYPSTAPLLTQSYRTISFLDDTIGLPKWLGILWWLVRLSLVHSHIKSCLHAHTLPSYIRTYIHLFT